MATVAFQVLHNNNQNKNSTPFLSASSNLHPPGLTWSSSPLHHSTTASTTHGSSNGLLPSSGSKSDSSNTSTEDHLPTPKDIINNASAAIANINRKRRVVWDLTLRSSCLSSPKHRYHPYYQPNQQSKAAAAAQEAASSDAAVPSSSASSSPSRRTRHRRSNSRSASSAFKPPRSILKCLRNAKVAQYNLTHSSPGKRAALHALSPGGRPSIASPSASPRRRSSFSYFAASSRSPGRSPGGRSPRVPSLSFGIGGIGSKSPSLAEITRANGGGRKHTVAFPDLRISNLVVDGEIGSNAGGNNNGAMMMSMSASNAADTAQQGSNAASLSAAVNGQASNATPTTTSTGLNGANTTSSANIGLGLGQPFESTKPSNGESASSNDADPRMHIISACHTLKHSLASPVWQDPTSHINGQDAPPQQQQAAEEDCFDSQPFDFPPRNLEQVLSESTESSVNAPRRTPFPSVHLRELEAAYATIFQYAQIYIQAWYNVATPESASTSTSTSIPTVQQPNTTPVLTSSNEDHLDREFAKLAPLVLKCVSRDLYRALHPVPVPSADTAANGNSTNVAQEKTTLTLEQTKEARQALLHRSGLSHTDIEEDLVGVSSSPLAFPNNSPDVSSASKIAIVPEKPKRVGRSTAEMRRRRNEINVVEAALQAFGTLVSCERFWRYFDVGTLRSTLCEAAEIPTASLFKGTKHRDLLSSFNWIIANQTLSTPAYLTVPDTVHPLKSSLDTILGAIMSSIDSSTKNGEKARRIISEGLRATRTLVLAYPSETIMRLVGEDYVGKISFFARHLCSPTKALRDNAALLLSAIAFSMTANWDDQSHNGRIQKAKAQEMVSMELYKYWSLSPDQVEIDELSRHLTIALDTKLPSDYHFVRLVVNTLPIILGRRFRKMERKGPHMWLSKAVELKKREDLQNVGPSYSAAFHLLTFLHVTYAWTSSSKEVAGKHMILLDQVRRSGGETPRQVDGQKMEEGFWGLGDKALRVIAQNIDAVTGKPWTKATYSHQIAAYEIDAAVALILSFTYAFVGLSYTAYQATTLVDDAEKPQNPSLYRDLSKLYEIFIGKYMPGLLKAKIANVRAIGWRSMHALLRAGEEHPTEDAALRKWSLDRVINWRMMGVYASQAGQASGPVDLMLSETIKPQEIPSLEAAWVYDNRASVSSVLLDAYKALVEDIAEGNTTTAQDSPDAEEWVKNEDGHAIMPSSVSNCIRTFFNTLRAAVGQEDSHVEPAESTLDLVLEMAHFVFSIVDEFGLKEVGAVSNKDGLSMTGCSYSTLLHLVNMLEHIFGSMCMQSTCNGRRAASVVDDIAQYTLALSEPSSDDLQSTSAYLSLIDYVFTSIKPTPKSMEAVFSKLPDLLQVDSIDAPPAHLSVQLWCRTIQWTARGIKADSKIGESLATFVSRLLALAPILFPDSKPEEAVRTAYTFLLARSSPSPTEAWKTLQQIGRQTGECSVTEDIFLAWSTLPLMREVSLMDDPSFFTHVAKTAAIAESAPESPVWSLVDLVLALTAGLSQASASAAARVLRSLSTTFTSLSSSTSISHDLKTRLYLSVTEAFESAFKQDAEQMGLDTFAPLLMCCSTERVEDFVSAWNVTYGTVSEPLSYSKVLKNYIQAALDQGHELRLPGWPEKAQHKQAAKASAAPVAESTPVFVPQEPSTVEESLDSGVVPETQSIDRPRTRSQGTPQPRALTSPAARLVDQLVQETPVDPNQTESEELSAIEETQHQSQSIAAAPVGTQMPRLSQIPDISDALVNAGDVSEIEAVTIIEETTIADSLEESNTSVIPETQQVTDKDADIEQVTTKVEPSNGKAGSELQDVSITAEDSITSVIPETQIETSESKDDARDREGSVDSELSELSEIEETQLIEDVIVIESTTSVVPEPSDEHVQASLPEVQTVAAQLVVAKDVTAKSAATDKSAAVAPAPAPMSKESVPDKPQSRLSVTHPHTSNPQSLPSPASSVSSSTSKGKAPVRRRQIVEVVIPFRPWIPRYPSVNRSVDENSQNSTRPAVKKPVQVAPSVSSKASKPLPVSRKHSREDVNDDEDDEEVLSSKKKQKSTNERGALSKLPKSALLPIKSAKEKQHKPLSKQVLQKADVSTSRRLKGTTSLPTIIHSKPAMDTTTVDSDDDDSISSSEEEIYVASSPHVSGRIKNVSDSVELARKLKRDRSDSYSQAERYKGRDKLVQTKMAEEGPTSSSPTTAVSQRVRTYSQSRGSSVTSSKRAGQLISSSRRSHGGASVSSSRGSGATSRTGKDLARILKDGRESDIEEVLEDLSAGQMQKLHQQIEERLKRVHGVKPVKRKRST